MMTSMLYSTILIIIIAMLLSQSQQVEASSGIASSRLDDPVDRNVWLGKYIIVTYACLLSISL